MTTRVVAVVRSTHNDVWSTHAVAMAAHMYEAKTLDRVKRKMLQQRIIQEDLQQRTRAASIDTLYTGTKVKDIPEFSLRVMARPSAGKMYNKMGFLSEFVVPYFRTFLRDHGPGCTQDAGISRAASEVDSEASTEPEGQTEAQCQDKETAADIF